MLKNSLMMFAVITPLVAATASMAQTTAGVDPACMTKSASGSQIVDMTKCPDGKKVGAGASTMAPADASKSTSTTGNAADAKATAPTAMANGDILVAPDKMTGAKIMSANDFIGKTVYSRSNESVGKVADVILSENGVQAVVLGVGGFLGMGTKDVAVKMSSIEVTKDGSSTKLVMDATKDQLKAAPTYDIKGRTYAN